MGTKNFRDLSKTQSKWVFSAKAPGEYKERTCAGVFQHVGSYSYVGNPATTRQDFISRDAGLLSQN